MSLSSAETAISRRSMLTRIFQVAALGPLVSLAACGGAQAPTAVSSSPSLATTVSAATSAPATAATVASTSSAAATASATFHWDLAPLPKGIVGRKPLAGGSNFLLPTGVKNPDASWLLMKYMGGPDGATFHGQDAGLFPSMPALAKPEIIPEFSATQISNILASGQDAIPLPFVAKYAQMDQLITAGLAPVWLGQSTAKEATAKLVPQVNALLQR
jgi:ABC-type glycerol-3-phosphate transport system substrate-binding protein